MKTYWVVDGSYALANVAGEMEPISGNDLFDRKFTILASGCDLPANNTCSVNLQRNNTIVLDIKSSQIVFTQWRFIRKIEHCPHCGHMINEEEASDE